MEPFIGQVVMFAGNFAPRGWAYCEGQLLSIAQNQALFSILGTTYGGDGRTTFGLPDLRGRAPIQPGTGPGLPTYRLGQRGGTDHNVLNVTQIPSHNHTAAGTLKTSSTGTSGDPAGNYPATASGRVMSGAGAGGNVQISDWNNSTDDTAAPNGVQVTVGNTGGNQAVNNMQPFLAINYIIALVGTFPSRN